MKKTQITVLLLALGQAVLAQSIPKKVIGSAGTTQTSGSSKLSWTLGEPVVGLMSAGGNQLGNGFYNTKSVKALSTEDFTMDVSIIVYPNPTSQFLFTDQKDNHQMEVTLIDLSGKILMVKKTNSNEAIDISDYNTGMYLVEVRDTETNKKNTYKILKK